MTVALDWLECNRQCDCWPIERGRVAQALPESVRASLDERHTHLFAQTGVFVHRRDFLAMTEQIQAIEALAVREDYRQLTLKTAALQGPHQQFDLCGALMGYDFHLSADGPKLIEINTNAGGAFLVDHIQRTLGLSGSVLSAADTAQALLRMFISEWRLGGRTGLPGRIAIVDEAAEQEYLYSDMQLAADLLRPHFDSVVVVDSSELVLAGGELRLQSTGARVDLVYNRLTDFMLTEATSRTLSDAWHSDAVVVTPSPRHHALLANKLNLALLANPVRWRESDLGKANLSALSRLPAAVAVTADNATELWQQRKQLFFKPASGYAGRAAYRGAKLTAKTFARLVTELPTRPYVAQALVPAAQRLLPAVQTSPAQQRLLKFDVRVFSYAGEPLLLAARVYQGQTTNFRTPGGGFAPVAIVDGQWHESAGCLPCGQDGGGS